MVYGYLRGEKSKPMAANYFCGSKTYEKIEAAPKDRVQRKKYFSFKC